MKMFESPSTDNALSSEAVQRFENEPYLVWLGKWKQKEAKKILFINALELEKNWIETKLQRHI